MVRGILFGRLNPGMDGGAADRESVVGFISPPLLPGTLTGRAPVPTHRPRSSFERS